MNDDMPKIIVAHPGKQHSYRLAGALEKAGYLFKYITTVYDSEKSVLMRLVKKLIGKSEKKRASNRSTGVIPATKIKQFCEFEGFIVLAFIRIDKKKYLYNWYSRHVSKLFGKKVAAYAIKNNVSAVICYDASARFCFEILKRKAPQIKRIIDNAAMNRYGLYKIYQELDRDFGILKNRTGFKEYLLYENKANPFKREALLADYHIVASSFSKYTLTSIGIEDDKVAVIPYGVETNKISAKTEYIKNRKLRLLYVGEISPQKGIYSLIEIADRFHDAAEIHIAGGGMEKLSLQNRNLINEKMVYHGYLLQEELFKLYSECDLFVFPTLGDGFGFVVIEAMAAGLPVICSGNSVGSDAVHDGENGFVFQAGNICDLEKRIEFFLNNRDKVEYMGKKAIKTAKSFTWEIYDLTVKNFIATVINR